MSGSSESSGISGALREVKPQRMEEAFAGVGEPVVAFALRHAAEEDSVTVGKTPLARARQLGELYFPAASKGFTERLAMRILEASQSLKPEEREQARELELVLAGALATLGAISELARAEQVQEHPGPRELPDYGVEPTLVPLPEQEPEWREGNVVSIQEVLEKRRHLDPGGGAAA